MWNQICELLYAILGCISLTLQSLTLVNSTMLVYGWASVADAGPTINQHCSAFSDCLESYSHDTVLIGNQQTLNQYWFNAGPPSAILGQHYPSIGPACRVDHSDRRRVKYVYVYLDATIPCPSAQVLWSA